MTLPFLGTVDLYIEQREVARIGLSRKGCQSRIRPGNRGWQPNLDRAVQLTNYRRPQRTEKLNCRISEEANGVGGGGATNVRGQHLERISHSFPCLQQFRRRSIEALLPDEKAPNDAAN